MTFDQIKKKLKDKRVGIAGCGGLGSNCAVALARVGVGTLVIADFDIIDKGNLNRQYYFYHQIGLKKTDSLSENIRMINPRTTVEKHDVKLDAKSVVAIYSSCDVIVEAFDQAGMKQMIIEALSEFLPEIPLVVGLGMAGWGDSNSIHCRKADQLYICGDEEKEVSDGQPPLAPRVGMVANMQANVVLEILLDDDI